MNWVYIFGAVIVSIEGFLIVKNQTIPKFHVLVVLLEVILCLPIIVTQLVTNTISSIIIFYVLCNQVNLAIDLILDRK